MIDCLVPVRQIGNSKVLVVVVAKWKMESVSGGGGEKRKGNEAKLISRISLGFQSKQQIANFD